MAVVVGYAGNDEGRAALARAAAEASLRGTSLLVVDTGREPTPAAELAAALDALDVEHEVVPPGPVRDAAEEVIAAAAGAELVVIGLRRRSSVGKLILGANATRILLESPCPVITVKPPAPAR
ncbi:Universal stress protein family protein [Quadrisphaera granulorum]|uniref:Universal stress protein family protein n=1 Tax=Quadrisphaera granulorum TaxID=317664 RepID=A0A315ZUL5_9ACTN|nr:universal stress protein [Quadrisphaera granulorum]PWJ49266.1 universal stress protein family protein [Quadrisphaera granulorum]SZE98183.1 Universal stress protein family protein [Quadrisphaera granulorum]